MKLDLTELLQRVGEETDFEQTDEVSFPEDDLKLTKPVSIKLHLVNTGTAVLVKGTAKTELELTCSRCLENFRLPFSVKIDEAFAKNVPEYTSGADLRPEDFVYPIEPDNSLDLTEIIRQNLVLALPIRTLCNKDCKGV